MYSKPPDSVQEKLRVHRSSGFIAAAIGVAKK